MNNIAYDERKPVYEEALRKWGSDAQTMMAVEEMSELTKELCKLRRGGRDLDALADEVADVTIMMEQLRLIYGINDQVCEHMDRKIQRLQERLGMSVHQDEQAAPAPTTAPAMSRVERMFGRRESWNAPQQLAQTGGYTEGYKGFLLIRCPECGEVRGFCTKAAVTESICRNCGTRIPLECLIPAHVNCGKCGSHFKYRTNIDTDGPVHIACLECEAPVDLQLNGKGTALVTIGDRRGGTNDRRFKTVPYYLSTGR